MKLSRFLTRLGMPRTAAPADPTTTPEFKAWFGRSVVVNSDGSPKRVLHGSTHTFDRFDPSKGDEEGYYGAGLYFSDDPDDVNRHYGRPDGADLTSRIERRAEEIQNTFEDTWDEEKQGPLPEGWTQQHALAVEQAKKELVGAHEGTVYLTYLKMLKPVIVTPYGGTHFAGGRWNPRNEDEWMDSRDSSRLHAAFLRAADALTFGGDGQDIWDEVSSSLSEFGIDDTSAFDLEKAVRGCNAVSECRGGAGSFMGLVYRLMGFDGVIMDATVTFPGMTLNTGTMHYIVWKPTQVKSALGNAGTFNPRSPRMVAHREAGVYDGYCPICGQAGCNGRCVETRKRAKLEHDIEDASGRVVTCSLRGDKGPSFDIQASVEGTGLQAEVSVISAVGRWNHGTKPFVLHAEDKGSPLATTQDLINQVWQVLEQEYRPLIDAALAAKDRTNAALTDRELRNRKQEIMGDLVDAFVKKPGNKWTGWKQPKASKTASTWKKAAEGLVVDSPSVDQFYSIAAKIMGQDVKTFDTFLTKLRQELGPQFPAFLKALGGYAGLRPVWDAVIERDEDDLKQSLEHMRVSPRKPSAAETVRGQAREIPLEDAHGENRLQPDLESMSRDEDTLAHNVSLMTQYPNFQGIAGKGTPQEQAEAIIEIMKDNLIWLYNAWGKGLRERSRMWYVGGNRITHRWAKRFGIDPHKIAGVLAALSPQQQWFQNVTLAERMLSALTDHADQPWDNEMTACVNGRGWGAKDDRAGVSPRLLLPELEGKTLNDFKKEGSLYKQAIWIRAWDEAHNPNMCREVTPEGEFGDWFRTNDGVPVANRWQSMACLMKALQLLETTNLRRVSDLVGENHKVRSFYNNLIAPDSEGGDVTIDTHAVAAALLRPLSATSREVAHNFGQGLLGERGPASSNITGATGLYGFYAEAYRRAAKATGVKPRELQSITWESVRGLFRPEDKRKGGAKMQSAVNKSWEDHSRGRIHADTAREQILNHAGGIDAPSWSVPHSGGDEGSRDSSYQGELSGDGIPGSGGTSGRGTGGRAASRVSALEGARRVVAKFLQPKTAKPIAVPPELVREVRHALLTQLHLTASSIPDDTWDGLFRRSKTGLPVRINVMPLLTRHLPTVAVKLGWRELWAVLHLLPEDRVTDSGRFNASARQLTVALPGSWDHKSKTMLDSTERTHVWFTLTHEFAHVIQCAHQGEAAFVTHHSDLDERDEGKAYGAELSDMYRGALELEPDLTPEEFLNGNEIYAEVSRQLSPRNLRYALRDLGYVYAQRRNSTGADHRSANACGTAGLLRTASRAVQVAAKFLQPKTAPQLRYVRLANTPKNRALLKDTVVGDTHIDNAIQMDFLKDMDDLILAYEGETIVGALSYGQGPAFGEVTISHIGTSRPGEGIGKALMSKLPPATKSYYVLAEPQSFGFYEALGFVDAVDSPDWGQAEDGNKPMRKTGSTAESETLEIRERSKTPEARKPHTFQAAEWTHPNGHPRCRICGDEEREGGRCSGAKTASTSCTQCGGPTRNCKCAGFVHASQGLCHGCWHSAKTAAKKRVSQPADASFYPEMDMDGSFPSVDAAGAPLVYWSSDAPNGKFCGACASQIQREEEAGYFDKAKVVVEEPYTPLPRCFACGKTLTPLPTPPDGPGTPVTAYAKEEAWMSPEGELNDVSGEGHQAGAANILGHYPVDEMPAGEQGGAILNTDFADTDFSSMLMEQGWARVAFESNITVLEGNTPTQAMMESLQSALMSRPSSPNDVVWWEAKKPYHRSARVSLQSFLSLNKMSDVWRLKEASMRTATSDELGRVARVEPGSSAPLSSPPASLFHGTPIPNAIEIMQSNSLTDGIHWGRPNEPHGPRFTTSLEVAKEFGTYPWGGDNLPGWAVFELDGHALAKAYTLVEYHDTGADGGSFGEEDEVAAVTSAISPLSRFLKAVHLSPIPKDELGYIADFVADTLEVPKATWLKEYRELLRSPKVRRTASTEATTRLDEPVVSYSAIAKVVTITIGDSEVAAHVVPERSQAVVGNLWAAQRGTGIGTRLMLALCDWCKAHGIKFITGTDVSPNRESSKIRQKLPGKSLLFQRKFEEDNAPSGADIWPDAPDAMKAILRSITPDPSGNVMVTKLAKLLRSKTAAVDPMASVRKFMHLLPTGMPLPEIKIEDTPSKGWLGRCVYTYGSPSTTIHLQKVILTDQDTLDRVVAHELCHHAEFLESAEAAAAKGWSPKQHAAMDKFLRRSHGTPWRAWADKFNAIYGANFVTERSDEAMVKADATKTIYVLLWKRGNSLLWSYAVRPSAKQVAVIKDNLAQGPEKYRYVTTRDVDFVQGTPVGRGWSRTDHEGLNEKLQKLWDSAPQVKVASETIEDGVYSMPLDEAIEEHVALVDALESPSHEDDAEKAKEQGAELKEMLEAKAKEKTAAGPGDVIATSDELTAWMDRFLDAHLDGGSVEALIVSDTDARLSFLAGPDLQGDDDAYMSFSEAFNKRVVTSRYPIAKVNGGVLARWALTKLDGDMAFPIHATMKAQGLKLPPKLTAAQIASGALDKALTGPKNSLYWFWVLRLWASRNYPQVGIEGSSRLAYALDKDHAFKIAKNAAGVAQNLTESHVAQNLHDLPITQVHHVVKEGAALVVDLAHELNEQHFFQDFGLSFHDFSTAVAEMAGAGLDEKRAIEDSLPPKAGQLLESLRRHRLPVSDLIFEHQWGDFHNHAVILDYGLSHEVYQEHYRKGAKFLQPKQAAGTATIPPKLAPHVQATGGLGAAATWHTKVWLGNSGTKDHTEVGMVAFDPETGTIVPVASSDEHQNGWDLIRYLKGKKIIPDLPYVTVFLSANYVDTESPEEVAKALKAYTAWRQLGGANITVCSRYRSGRGFRVSMDDFIKAKGVPDTSYAPGKLTPVADRLVKALQVLGKGYAALHTNPGARVPKSLLTAARAALTEFKHTGMCGWAQLQSATENLLTLEAGGDPTPFEQSVYTMNGLKNTIHNQLRKFGENQFTDRDLVEVFGDPGLAKAAFDSLAEG